MLRYLILCCLIIMVSLSSCTTTQSSLSGDPNKMQEFERDEYVLLDKTTGQANSFRFKLLFIPFGGASDERLYQKAYNRAVESIGENADGLLSPQYQYRRTRIPLIVCGFQFKKVTASGRAFRLKSDQEIQYSK